MKATIARLIKRYGTQMQVSTERGKGTIRAFLQLVTSKSWQNMERMISTGGEIPRGQYLFIGAPDCGVGAADVLRAEGHTYIVRRADKILFRDEPIFIWGLCVEGGGEDPWAASSEN